MECIDCHTFALCNAVGAILALVLVVALAEDADARKEA
jgi:hypothetical protein